MTDAESKDANAEDFEFLLEPFKGAWKPILMTIDYQDSDNH